jgi:hypothetical protein
MAPALGLKSLMDFGNLWRGRGVRCVICKVGQEVGLATSGGEPWVRWLGVAVSVDVRPGGPHASTN